MLNKLLRLYYDKNNISCKECGNNKLKELESNCYFCNKCKSVYKFCDNCFYKDQYRHEIVMMKYIGFDGIVKHPHYHRYLRPNGEIKINPHENVYMREDITFCKENILIPYYVGDQDIYCMKEYLKLEKDNCHINKLNHKTQENFWKCEVCKNIKTELTKSIFLKNYCTKLLPKVFSPEIIQ